MCQISRRGDKGSKLRRSYYVGSATGSEMATFPWNQVCRAATCFTSFSLEVCLRREMSPMVVRLVRIGWKESVENLSV